MLYMNKENWKLIENFTPEKFGCVDMAGVLIYTLQAMREYVGKAIIIHCGYESRGSGYHPKKCAADLHIDGLHVIDQFLIASRFDAFNGLGVYPNWNSPGLHIDTRPIKNKFDHDARWGCLEPGEYVSIDKEFFKKIV